MATQTERDAERLKRLAQLIWPRKTNAASSERIRAGRALHFAGIAIALLGWLYWGSSYSAHDKDILFWLSLFGLIGGRVARYILADE
jgi:hypothetical protein